MLASGRASPRRRAATSIAATAGRTCATTAAWTGPTRAPRARQRRADRRARRLTGLPGGQRLQLALGFGAAPRAAPLAPPARRSGTAASPRRARTTRPAGAPTSPRCGPVPASAGASRASYNASVMVLAAHEDKTFRGGFVAAPGPAVGMGERAAAPARLHAVWSRDLYEIATGLLAAGDSAAANRALDYLWTVQQRPDGSFPQNSRLDGEPVFGGLQMDEVAFPIVLAWQLGRTGAGRLGPRAPARRTSSSPTGRAPTRSAGRTSAATRRRRSPPRSRAWSARRTSRARTASRPSADRYLAVADEWQGNLEALDADAQRPAATRSRTTCGSPKNGDANSGTEIQIADGGPLIDQRTVVDPSFLELVRLGVKSADDPHIGSTAAGGRPRARSTRRRTGRSGTAPASTGTASGPTAPSGSPCRPGSGETIGRGWPLLTGERGEYALAAGQPAQQLPGHDGQRGRGLRRSGDRRAGGGPRPARRSPGRRSPRPRGPSCPGSRWAGWPAASAYSPRSPVSSGQPRPIVAPEPGSTGSHWLPSGCSP